MDLGMVGDEFLTTQRAILASVQKIDCRIIPPRPVASDAVHVNDFAIRFFAESRSLTAVLVPECQADTPMTPGLSDRQQSNFTAASSPSRRTGS